MVFAMPFIRGYLCCLVVLSVVLQFGTQAVNLSLLDPGCADGTRDGLHSLKHVAACSGEWRGHIATADHLCAPGWSVCSYKDKKLLKLITWQDATEFGGCFAFNAAQDGGECNECRDHLERDDLAAVGQGCPHQNYGQTSCITGGKIDASCCVDTHFNKSCIYQPGLMTGVVCCRGGNAGTTARPSKTTTVTTSKLPIHLTTNRELQTTAIPKYRSRMTLKVQQGVPVFVTCHVADPVSPKVRWYKDGRILPGSSRRVSILTSGDLFIVPSKTTDSGLYTCTYASQDGKFISVETELVVGQKYGQTSRSSLVGGCAVGVQEKLSHLKNVRACSGAWLGHIRKGKRLCARGWHVCNPKDETALHNISWDDIIKTDGCFAYNAANLPNKCSRCRGESMAGVGKNCGIVRKNSQPSCLPAGHVTVFQKQKSGCYYMPGVTSGVLCCRRRRVSYKEVRKWIYPECNSGCKNGGRCIATNQCLCPEGFSGRTCQLPVCRPDCGSRGTCVKPGVCKCQKGYIGRTCKIRMRHYRCRMPCYNGGKCHKGRCNCSKLYWGTSCQHIQQFAKAHWNSTED